VIVDAIFWMFLSDAQKFASSATGITDPERLTLLNMVRLVVGLAVYGIALAVPWELREYAIRRARY
jgi:hypothetical protein